MWTLWAGFCRFCQWTDLVKTGGIVSYAYIQTFALPAIHVWCGHLHSWIYWYIHFSTSVITPRDSRMMRTLALSIEPPELPLQFANLRNDAPCSYAPRKASECSMASWSRTEWTAHSHCPRTNTGYEQCLSMINQPRFMWCMLWGSYDLMWQQAADRSLSTGWGNAMDS